MAKVAAVKRTYFLTYLLPSSFTETELQAHKQTVDTLVTKHKGSIVNVEEWGKRRLAYKLKHSGKWFTEAFYIHLTLSMESSRVTAFEKDIYLQSQILRHLLVVTEEADTAKTE